MKKKIAIKSVGMVLSIAGMAMTVIQQIYEDIKMSEMIDEKLDEKLAKRNEDEES